jgi:hypothetical protein
MTSGSRLRPMASAWYTGGCNMSPRYLGSGRRITLLLTMSSHDQAAPRPHPRAATVDVGTVTGARRSSPAPHRALLTSNTCGLRIQAAESHSPTPAITSPMSRAPPRDAHPTVADTNVEGLWGESHGHRQELGASFGSWPQSRRRRTPQSACAGREQVDLLRDNESESPSRPLPVPRPASVDAAHDARRRPVALPQPGASASPPRRRACVRDQS